MVFSELSSEKNAQNNGDLAVVCFDCQYAHDMRFSSWMQAEAFAAVMTRHERPCPMCGCHTWVAMGDMTDVMDGAKVRTFDSFQG